MTSHSKTTSSEAGDEFDPKYDKCHNFETNRDTKKFHDRFRMKYASFLSNPSFDSKKHVFKILHPKT